MASNGNYFKLKYSTLKLLRAAFASVAAMYYGFGL
jgi:hypothetical protein